MGDKGESRQTRNQVAEHNVGLAIWVARKHSGKARARGIDEDDLVQEAQLMLLKAAETYDETKGTFPSYAQTLICRRFRDLFRAKTVDSQCPVASIATQADPALTWRQFRQSPQQELKYLLQETHEKILALFDTLPITRRRIVHWYFGYDGHELSLVEIAKRLGITKQCVHRTLDRTLNDLFGAERKGGSMAVYGPLAIATQKHKLGWCEKALDTTGRYKKLELNPIEHDKNVWSWAEFHDLAGAEQAQTFLRDKGGMETKLIRYSHGSKYADGGKKGGPALRFRVPDRMILEE